MKIIPKADLSELMGALVHAGRSLRLRDGGIAPMMTFDEKAMRAGAIAALTVLCGESVLAGDET